MTPALAFATFLVVASLIAGLFLAGDRALSGEQRLAVSRWIYGAPRESMEPAAWHRAFLAWFDRVFRVRAVKVPVLGELHLPSFWRSVLASLISLFLLALVWLFNARALSRPLRFESSELLALEEIGPIILIYGGATLITNWIPDYLSLIQSRYVMARMAESPRAIRRVGWLVLDAVLTAGIALSALYIGCKVVLWGVGQQPDLRFGCETYATFTLQDGWHLFLAGLRFEGPPGTLHWDAAGIYIYSTFITSLWVWIYLAAGFSVRAVYLLRGGGDVDASAAERWAPVRTLGIVAVLAFAASFWPTWAQRQAEHVDVYVAHTPDGEAAARMLEARLEKEGLDVVVLADAPSDRVRQEAELVLILESTADEWGDWSREGDDLRWVSHETWEEMEWGARPEGSLRVIGTHMLQDPIWRDQTVAETVDWALHTTSLLRPNQISACHERMLRGEPVGNAAGGLLRP